MLQECIFWKDYRRGRRIHAHMVIVGYVPNEYLKTKLLILYAKSGCLETARFLFNDLVKKDLFAWNAIIAGYVQKGLEEDGTREASAWCYVEVSNWRQCCSQWCINRHVTFLAVLVACSYGGLIDEGHKYVQSMIRDYGIVPQAKHYATMVDLLGRSGKLKEAYEFVLKSPCKEHSVIWGALLGAWKIHGDLDLLKIASKKYFEFERVNAGKYVALANAYALSGLWDDVEGVRASLRESGVTKEPCLVSCCTILFMKVSFGFVHDFFEKKMEGTIRLCIN
ncbi:unnamed protein product [Vicia faba]|uniref:Pentatricopeptide repeat-containing protein n=1 Tax=Vicia faba TaxID=3906 RepID=A0AAV0ZXL3_VICFA|nr:unnamed protein product [Vicia faba]